MLSRRLQIKNALAKREGHHWSCDPAGIRTQDPILKRDVLYLLSY
jgi:hypothetical protein